MSQTALGVLIFLSVLLFLALAIGIPLTIVLVRRKRVCRNSKLIAWHNAVRQKPLISKDYTHHFSRTICVNSRRSAVNFSFSKGLSSACQDSKRTLLNAIERHHYYEAIYAEYLVASKEAYQRLKATEDDAKKAKMSLASFKKIEVHFIRELGFLRDREPISITIAVSYTSPMGRSTYNNSVTFDEQAIIRYVGQPVEHIFSRPEEWKLPEEVPGATKTQKAQERVEEKEQVISVASEAIPLPKPESEPTVSEEKALVTTSVDKSEGQPLSSPALEENVPAKLKKKFGYNESVLLLSLPQGYFYRVGYRKIFVFRTSHSDYGLSWREAPNPLRFEFETLFAKVCLTYINASYPPEAFIIEISVLVKCLQKAFECDDVSETDIRRIFLPEGSNRGYITRDAVSIRATRPYQERTTEGLKTEIVFASLSIGTKIPEKPKEKIIALVAGQFIEAKPVPQPIPLPAEEVKTRVIAQPLPPKKPVSHAAVQSDSSKKAESSGSIIQSPQGNGSFIDIDRKTPIKLLVMTKSGIFGINSDSDDLAFTLSPDFQRSISWREADDESIKAIKSYIADQCFDVFKNACEADGKSASPERLSREINRKLKTLAFTYRDVCEAICRGVPYNLVTLEEICQAAGREFPTHPESNPKNEHECFGDKKELRVFDYQLQAGNQPAQRFDSLVYKAKTCNLVLINYESLPRNVDALSRLIDDKTMLVFDEVHRVKGVEGIRAAAALSLCRYSAAQYRVVLTGTPIPNGFADTYNFLHILFPDQYESVFTYSVSELKQCDQNAALRRDLNDKLFPFFCITTKEMLKVPPADPDDLTTGYCLADSKDEKLYEIVRRVCSDNPLLMYVRLMQASCNPALILKDVDPEVFDDFYDPDDKDSDSGEFSDAFKKAEKKKKEVFSPDDRFYVQNYGFSPKFYKGIDIIKSEIMQGHNIIAWGIFISTLEKIKHELRRSGIACEVIDGQVPLLEREAILDKFQSGEINVLIANPATLAESVSLHKNCHVAIYFEYSFNLVHLLQSKDRIHRLGLPAGTKTHYYFMIMDNPQAEYQCIDMKILQRLAKKANLQKEAVTNDQVNCVPGDLEEEIADLVR